MVHRSANGHREKIKRLPFIARLRRDEPLRPADQIELNEAADRIAGPTGWYSMAGYHGKADCKLIRFATLGEAEEMQRWLDRSGIAERPMPKLGETKEEKAAAAREVIDWALSTGAGRRIVQAYRRELAAGEGHISGMLAAYAAATAAGLNSDGLVPAVEFIIRWAQDNHAEWFYRFQKPDRPAESPAAPAKQTHKMIMLERSRWTEPDPPSWRPVF